MLNLQVTISGDKVVIHNLQALVTALPGAVQRGLSRSIRGIHSVAFDYFLNGEGSKGITEVKTSKSGNQYLKWRKRDIPIPAGGYPVPKRSGNLQRLLKFLDPGQTADGISAGPMEAIDYDTAVYSHVIHEGFGSSARFGPRRFLVDAFEIFNRGPGVVGAIENEIQADLAKLQLN